MTGKESFSYTWVNPYQLSCPGSSVGRALAYMGGHFRQNSSNRLDPEIFIMGPRIFGVESFILRLGLRGLVIVVWIRIRIGSIPGLDSGLDWGPQFFTIRLERSFARRTTPSLLWEA